MSAELAIIAIATAFGSKEVVTKLLGPTADYLGGGLKGLTQKSVENINRIFAIAVRRLGPKIDAPGQVPARVLKHILTEGYFCDNTVAAEYFGGILASSRSENGQDDRGAYFAGMVGRLSTYQIRSHYVLYQCFKHAFNGLQVPFQLMELREKASVFIPLTNYVEAMGCATTQDITPYLEHASVGLINESLLSDYFDKGHCTRLHLSPSCGMETQDRIGIVAAPTRLGLELFMWAQAMGNQPAHQFFEADNVFPLLPEVKLSFDGVEKTPTALHWGLQNG